MLGSQQTWVYFTDRSPLFSAFRYEQIGKSYAFKECITFKVKKPEHLTFVLICRFHWDKRGGLAESLATIIWDIPADQKPGMYRVTYNCDHKSIISGVSTTSGSTEWFQVVASKAKMDKLFEKNNFKLNGNTVKKDHFRNLFTDLIKSKKGNSFA